VHSAVLYSVCFQRNASALAKQAHSDVLVCVYNKMRCNAIRQSTRTTTKYITQLHSVAAGVSAGKVLWRSAAWHSASSSSHVHTRVGKPPD